MSNENNSRPAGRDELDIDRLIRSIRSTEQQPEQPALQRSAQTRQESAPVSGEGETGSVQQTEAPAIHLAQPERPLTRQEREDRDPGIQQMRSQIQSIMAAWGDQPEASAPVSVQAPEPAPRREQERTSEWKIPEIVLPPVEEEPNRKTELPKDWQKAPEGEPEEEPRQRRQRPSLNERLAFLRNRREERQEAAPPVETSQPEPEPSEAAGRPEPEQPRREPEETDAALSQPEQAGERERQAFAQGQVITLRLHRSAPEQSPEEHRIFDQEEDDALEAMLADNAREFRARQEAEQAAAEKAAAEQAAERAAAEQAAAERAAAEKAAAEQTAAEKVAAEQAAAEKAAAEAETEQPGTAEPEAPLRTEAEAPFQVLTLNLRRPETRTEEEPAPQQIFDQEREEELPEEPVLPEQPEAPEEPVLREQPEAPEEPVLPEQPEAPEEPVLREQPEAPEQPVLREQPEAPEEPVLREQPEAPEEPVLPEQPEKSEQSPRQGQTGPAFQVLTLRLNRSADRPEGEKPSHRAVEQEQEDEELEAMLAAHAGPAVEKPQMEIVPAELPAQAEEPEQEASPEEPEQTADGEPSPARPEEEPETAQTPAEEEQPAENTDTPDAQPDEETEEDWEEGVADESLLERPDRGPGLVQRLAALAVGLLQRPKKQTEPEDADYEEKTPSQPKRPDKVVELPQEKSNPLQRKLEEVEERANDFADSMFQGDSEEAAEEEKLHRKAERYIPGTDEEREPRRRPKPVKEKKAPVRRAPDTSPKELSRIFYSSWKSGKGRLPFQLMLALTLILLSALAGGDLPFVQIPALTENPKLAGILLTVGLAGACALGLDTLLEGIFQLFRGRPGLNTLASIGVLLTLADGVWFSVLGREGPLPFCGFAALSLWSVAWGNCRKKQGLYLSCQMAAAVSHPQRLTLDQGKWDNKGTFIKETGTTKGFGSQMQEPDGAQQVYRYAAPVMIAACLIFGILAAVGQRGVGQLVWNWSVIFVLATPLAATLAYGVPYTKLVKRLNRSGVILAGWEGADSMKGEAGIAITDSDLFPEGYVQFNGIKNFGQVSLEKLTGCTASVMREMDTGLAKIFDDLIRTQGGFYRRVDDLKAGEGGFSGLIRGDQVLVGNADYMKLMGVPLQQGYQVRNAVFCVINGELQGIFALNYSLAHSIQPALNALIHGHVNPILATRDFNITPTMLRQRFRLPADRMEYPPMDRRQLLSAKGQPHNETLGALIYREGLGACTDAILGGRRLRMVVRLNTILAVAASVVGALLGFYLTLMGAYHSLSPLNILFFLVMWLVPILLVSNGVDKF